MQSHRYINTEEGERYGIQLVDIGFREASLMSPPLSQYCDEVGDGSGNTNMAVDGSVTPVVFKIKPAAGAMYNIYRLIISIRDTGSFDSGGWGNSGGSPLTNGIQGTLFYDPVEVPLTAPIMSHVDLASVSYDVTHHNFGQGDEFVLFRYTFTKSGNTILLNGDKGDELRFYIQDDLTYLVQQRIHVQGIIRT